MYSERVHHAYMNYNQLKGHIVGTQNTHLPLLGLTAELSKNTTAHLGVHAAKESVHFTAATRMKTTGRPHGRVSDSLHRRFSGGTRDMLTQKSEN
ncbi:hypothetical protein CDAR_377691 [Caerostris darwini]|uniref:Uncharacterized protein n=1 Tax=Caerostris darwini TaxID=1538125 RepID=A0AAV4UPQ3_9ARAC|nr:hypothetical protein CDAR_377691 [Caerostris darwini]